MTMSKASSTVSPTHTAADDATSPFLSATASQRTLSLSASTSSIATTVQFPPPPHDEHHVVAHSHSARTHASPSARAHAASSLCTEPRSVVPPAFAPVPITQPTFHRPPPPSSARNPLHPSYKLPSYTIVTVPPPPFLRSSLDVSDIAGASPASARSQRAASHTDAVDIELSHPREWTRERDADRPHSSSAPAHHNSLQTDDICRKTSATTMKHSTRPPTNPLDPTYCIGSNRTQIGLVDKMAAARNHGTLSHAPNGRSTDSSSSSLSSSSSSSDVESSPVHIGRVDGSHPRPAPPAKPESQCFAMRTDDLHVEERRLRDEARERRERRAQLGLNMKVDDIDGAQSDHRLKVKQKRMPRLWGTADTHTAPSPATTMFVPTHAPSPTPTSPHSASSSPAIHESQRHAPTDPISAMMASSPSAASPATASTASSPNTEEFSSQPTRPSHPEYVSQRETHPSSDNSHARHHASPSIHASKPVGVASSHDVDRRHERDAHDANHDMAESESHATAHRGQPSTLSRDGQVPLRRWNALDISSAQQIPLSSRSALSSASSSSSATSFAQAISNGPGSYRAMMHERAQQQLTQSLHAALSARSRAADTHIGWSDDDHSNGTVHSVPADAPSSSHVKPFHSSLHKFETFPPPPPPPPFRTNLLPHTPAPPPTHAQHRHHHNQQQRHESSGVRQHSAAHAAPRMGSVSEQTRQLLISQFERTLAAESPFAPPSYHTATFPPKHASIPLHVSPPSSSSSKQSHVSQAKQQMQKVRCNGPSSAQKPMATSAAQRQRAADVAAVRALF